MKKLQKKLCYKADKLETENAIISDGTIVDCKISAYGLVHMD